MEELIVTPFAQILSSLRTVRNNMYNLTNVQQKYVTFCIYINLTTITTTTREKEDPLFDLTFGEK